MLNILNFFTERTLRSDVAVKEIKKKIKNFKKNYSNAGQDKEACWVGEDLSKILTCAKEQK